jgi:hypothetical protein
VVSPILLAFRFPARVWVSRTLRQEDRGRGQDPGQAPDRMAVVVDPGPLGRTAAADPAQDPRRASVDLRRAVAVVVDQFRLPGRTVAVVVDQVRLPGRTGAAGPGQHPNTTAVDPVPHPTNTAVDPGQHPTNTAVDPVPHPTSTAVDPGQHPTSTAVDPVPHPTSTAAAPAQR